MERTRVPASFISGLRDGDLPGVETLNLLLSLCGLELHSRAIVGSAKVCWVVDIDHDRFLLKGFLSNLDTKLRQVNAIQTSLNDWLEGGGPTLLHRFVQFTLELNSPPEKRSIPSYAVVVSAVVLLSLVYHYLTGNVDRGGSRAYSRSSLDFRDIYVAIVLFLGAYVWIKFREVALKGVHRRELKDQGGRITKVVYEPRFKPPRENGRKFEWIYLGQYATPEEASILYRIAAFYYDENQGSLLDLEHGRWFSIPPMDERERSLTGLEKRACVKVQVMKVYEEFKKEKAEAALFQEFLEAWDGEVPQEQDEGHAVSNGHSLGSQEGSAIPVSHLTPNTESGMGLNGSDRLDLLPIRLGTFEQQNSDHQQQIQEFGAQILQLRGSDQFVLLQTRLDTFQQQISEQIQEFGAQILQLRGSDQFVLLQTRLDTFQQQSSEQIEEFRAQILQLQHQRHIPQQQRLQESRNQNPQWPYHFGLQQQHLQGVNQGVPGTEVEMEQSMQQHNYPGLMAPPSDGGEVQEAFREMDTLP